MGSNATTQRFVSAKPVVAPGHGAYKKALQTGA